MLKKIIVIFCFTMLSQAVFAESCPSVDAVKQRQIAGWKLYDSDEGTVVTGKREDKYINTIKEFALAEWSNQGKKAGTIRCYYRDANGSELEAYLAKENFTVSSTQNYWYEVSGSMNCAAGSDKCVFDKSQVMASN